MKVIAEHGEQRTQSRLVVGWYKVGRKETESSARMGDTKRVRSEERENDKELQRQWQGRREAGSENWKKDMDWGQYVSQHR